MIACLDHAMEVGDEGVKFIGNGATSNIVHFGILTQIRRFL